MLCRVRIDVEEFFVQMRGVKFIGV